MNLNKTFYHIVRPLKVEAIKDRDGETIGWKGTEINECEPIQEECLMENFFEEQSKLPSSMRSKGAYLVCNCSRCKNKRGTL